MRHRVILLLTLAALAAALPAADLRFAVSYRSASTVYIAAGSADGLAVGEVVSIKARNDLIGEVEILFLAEHSASCRVVREKRPIKVGDEAVITRGAKTAPEVIVSDTAAKAGPDPNRPLSTAPVMPAAQADAPWARTRGAVSFGLSHSWDQTERHYDFEQRFARIDFSAWQIGGHPLQFTTRSRSRQDVRPQTLGFELLPRNERRDRIYEVALRYEPLGGRAIIEAGRLGVPSLGIGYVDGVSVEMRALSALRLGGFFGKRVQLDPFPGFQSGSKYGGYLRLAPSGASGFGKYDVSLFGIREFAGSVISREYVGAQSRFASRSFVFSQWAEVDLLRDWRAPENGGSTQLSNLSLSAVYRASKSSSLGLSYDQRRNYRTADNRSISQSIFDTFMHQGFRGSLDVSRANGLGGSLFGGVRMQDQQSDTAYSVGGGLRHPSLTGAHLGAGLDGYFFTTGTNSGLQGSARLGRSTQKLNTDMTVGLSIYTLKGASDRRQNKWFRLSAYRMFGHGLWLNGDLQYDRGDDVKGLRGTFEFGYRF